MKKKILFVERNFWVNAGIEKVFRQIAGKLPEGKFVTAFQNVKYRSSFFDLVRNLLFFKREEADIYHLTGDIHYLVFRLPAANTILTVHDLNFLHYRTGLRRYVLKKVFLDWPVKRVKYITAISQATKDEIVEHTGCAEEKVRVIANPMFDSFLIETDPHFDKANPLILHIGTAINKNLDNLVEALKGMTCRLKIIGKIEESLRQKIDDYGISLENIHGLNEAEMIEEYKKADIVAFCSEYEGFGLPIIEAQALHTPVVTSNIDPMKDVAGGAACLVDPFDPVSIRKGIQKVIDDDSYRNELLEKGRQNIRRFDSKRIAAQYEALYEEVSSNRTSLDQHV